MARSPLPARTRGPAIPLASTAELAGPARRTLVLRVALAVVLLVLVLLASETGRSNAAAARGLLPGGGTGMLVLDVSRSIKPEANRTITGVLQQLIRSQSRLGLVAFSDIAYQLLPPGTPYGSCAPCCGSSRPDRRGPDLTGLRRIRGRAAFPAAPRSPWG